MHFTDAKFSPYSVIVRTHILFNSHEGFQMHAIHYHRETILSNNLYIFYCHKLQQWGWVTSSRNISYDPPPTYTDQSKHVNMATKHIFNYTKS